MFCSPNVTWDFITPWSFLAIHHPELNEMKWKLGPISRSCLCWCSSTSCWARGEPRMWLRLDFKPSITQAHAEAKRWGRAPNLSCWDLWGSRAGWPHAGSVLGGAPGIPPHQRLWLKQSYMEDEARLAYKVVWRKYSGIPLFCKTTWGISSAGRTPWILQEGTFLLHK